MTRPWFQDQSRTPTIDHLWRWFSERLYRFFAHQSRLAAVAFETLPVQMSESVEQT